MTLSARTRSSEYPPTKAEASAKVLVVDDEPALRRSLARLLLSRGMQVVTADDGAAAIALLKEQHVDVALIDLMMPHVNGLELLDHIKANHSGVEVILMTAFGDVETAVRAVRAGAYHFLTKPFRSNDEVVLTVAKAAERRRLQLQSENLRATLDGVYSQLKEKTLYPYRNLSRHHQPPLLNPRPLLLRQPLPQHHPSQLWQILALRLKLQ